MDPTDRILGCIFGGALGDAMGGPYEGSKGPVRWENRAEWRLSDDTQLTLATCEAITAGGGVDPRAIAEEFVRWYRRGRGHRHDRVDGGPGCRDLRGIPLASRGTPGPLARPRGDL